ncbi:MAG: methionine ABC transporter ATP-binding protein [Chlamydiota bacterium]
MAPLIQVESLSKSFTRSGRVVHALKDVSLSVASGDVFGIIGLSGAGKSTLIRCLAKLVTPSSGRVVFAGSDLALMGEKELSRFRKNIGMIFQHFNLLSSRTVERNIAYPLEIAGVPKEEREKRVDELLHLVGLTEKKEAYPSQLSGGEKQRVGIARALATNPQMLLCDEATSALDPQTTQEILSLLKSVNKKLGVTIFLITHEMEVIKQICNQVAVIEQGRIAEMGPVAEVFSDPQHPTTKRFLQSTSHAIPAEFFKPASPERKLLRLRFKGKASSEPIISDIVRKFHVDANILLGWIDRLQTLTVGTLVIEVTGSAEGIQGAMSYLSEKSVHYEVLTNES